MIKKIWNRLFVNFFNGIVILLPAAVTVAIVRWLVIKLNDIVLSPLVKFFAPLSWGDQHVFMAKSVIFFAVIFAVTMIGWGAKVFMINRVFGLGERVLVMVPVIGKIYSTSKQIFNSLLGHGKTIFKQVVLVEYPRIGLYTIGFTTGITKGELKDSVGQSGVNVFVPTAPNPTSGFFLVVPRESIRFLKMSVEDGMKLVVSGGSIQPISVPLSKEIQED
jgi:uncharacterized membrane protein